MILFPSFRLLGPRTGNRASTSAGVIWQNDGPIDPSQRPTNSLVLTLIFIVVMTSFSLSFSGHGQSFDIGRAQMINHRRAINVVILVPTPLGCLWVIGR